MSGLVAAFHLTQQGIPVRIFEARERIGGRIMTVSEDGCPLPLQLGAEFIHGAAEPAMALADATGIAVERIAREHARFVDGKFRNMPDLWTRYAKILDGADEGPDQSATEYLKRKHPSGSDAELFRLIVEGFEAAPADDVSVRSLAREAKGLSGGNGELRPVPGFGAMCKALLHRLSSGLVDLHAKSAVEAIAWHPDGRCALRVRESETTRQFETMGCVITVPLGVLQSSSEKGSDPLLADVDALSAPLSRLAMGHVVKLVLVLREHAFMKSLPDTDFFHLPAGNFPSFWQQRLPDLRVITAWIGGSKARAIEAMDTRDLLDQVASDLAECCQVLPGEIRSLVAAHHHDFSRDPYSLGAYPYVRPEGAEAIAALAAPVKKALVFAGDATDPEHVMLRALSRAAHARRG